MDGEYEVLNPWAEVDPVPLRSISPRLKDIAGKTIGLFADTKPSARPMLSAVEQRLKERYPTSKFDQFVLNYNLRVTETEYKDKFEEWVKGVDAVIHATGD